MFLRLEKSPESQLPFRLGEPLAQTLVLGVLTCCGVMTIKPVWTAATSCGRRVGAPRPPSPLLFLLHSPFSPCSSIPPSFHRPEIAAVFSYKYSRETPQSAGVGNKQHPSPPLNPTHPSSLLHFTLRKTNPEMGRLAHRG